MSEYHPPRFRSERFHCPYCNALALHKWTDTTGFEALVAEGFSQIDPVCIDENVVHISFSSCCDNPTFWCNEKIIYPPLSTAPPANSNLPDDVKAIYEEASTISDQSPRAASALLRLAVEMLLEHIGRTGRLDTNIKNLVEEGLDPQIQQALDIVRVTGNHAVHPGEIVFDDPTDAQAIFYLVNIIAETFITQPKHIQKLYDNLPERDKKAEVLPFIQTKI